MVNNINLSSGRSIEMVIEVKLSVVLTLLCFLVITLMSENLQMNGILLGSHGQVGIASNPHVYAAQ